MDSDSGVIKNMNILIVSQYFWPENFRINDLALGLKEKGNKVTVLTGFPNYPEGSFFSGYSLLVGKENYNGIIIKRVPIFARGKAGRFRLTVNYLSFVVSAGILAPFYCREKYDAVFVFAVSPITQALPAILLKKIKRVPLFIWILDLWPETLTAVKAVRSPRVVKFVERLVRFIYRQCDLVLVASKGFIPSISSKGVNPEKIAFFPNWAEDIYQPIDPAKAVLPLALKEIPFGFRLMFAGNMGIAQDFETVLASFEMLKEYEDIHLLILGSGRMQHWVENQVKGRNLTNKVHLLGAYPAERMPDFFSIADAMLVTLSKDSIFSNTIPGKLQSYLACGKPVIGALDGEGAKLINASRAGIVCSPGEPKALSESILKMYRLNPNERGQMGLNARAYSEKEFNRDTLINNLEVLIMGKAKNEESAG